MPLGGILAEALKKPITKPKSARKIKGKGLGTQPQRGHTIIMWSRMISGQFVVVRVGVNQLSVSPNTSHPMLQIRKQ
jgi:hypothetical protein